jgi:hypothetical protein
MDLLLIEKNILASNKASEIIRSIINSSELRMQGFLIGSSMMLLLSKNHPCRGLQGLQRTQGKKWQPHRGPHQCHHTTTHSAPGIFPNWPLCILTMDPKRAGSTVLGSWSSFEMKKTWMIFTVLTRTTLLPSIRGEK